MKIEPFIQSKNDKHNWDTCEIVDVLERKIQVVTDKKEKKKSRDEVKKVKSCRLKGCETVRGEAQSDANRKQKGQRADLMMLPSHSDGPTTTASNENQ